MGEPIKDAYVHVTVIFHLQTDVTYCIKHVLIKIISLCVFYLCFFVSIRQCFLLHQGLIMQVEQLLGILVTDQWK